IEGVVSARLFDAPDRQHIVIAVNGRPVANRALLAAAEAGYRPVLRKGRHPVLVVAITVPPSALDVNVHPAKAEVLLRHESAICAALRTAVHQAIGSAPASAAGALHPPAAPTFAPAVQLRLPAPRRRRGLLLGEQRGSYHPRLPEDDDLPAGALPELE